MEPSRDTSLIYTLESHDQPILSSDGMEDRLYLVWQILNQETGLTQGEFCKTLGITLTSLNRYFEGTKIPSAIAVKLANGYGVDLQWFLGGIPRQSDIPKPDDEGVSFIAKMELYLSLNRMGLRYQEELIRREKNNSVPSTES